MGKSEMIDPSQFQTVGGNASDSRHDSNYSVSQMDNFYETLGNGLVKPSGIMNYMQHLFIAERCLPGSSVLDVCCGRALMVPLLKRYAPKIANYVGVDIAPANLSEARQVIALGDKRLPEFSCRFVEGDVTKLSSIISTGFDVVIYLSSLEHLNRDAGILSLREVSRVLGKNGVLYLSTPNTPKESPRKLQYKVHVYEWQYDEIREVLQSLDIEITKCIGLLPPPKELLLELIDQKYGTGSAIWFQELQASVPDAFLGPVMAATFPEYAKETMFICRKVE